MRSLFKSLLPATLQDLYRKVKKRFLLSRLAGREFYCPICEKHFASFLTHGLARRKNAKCPNCGSLERHRLQYLFLRDKLSLFDGRQRLKLLHFAPEKCFVEMFTRNEHIDYVGCDLSPQRYDGKGKFKIVKVDITSIPFGECTFDAILCNHVLEHIPDDRLAMSELYRVLKVGGWGVFQVPIDYARETTYEDSSITDPVEREKAFGQNDHVRWYGRDFPDRLESAGFTVSEDNFVMTLSKSDRTRYSVMETELIYYCTRK